MSVSSPSRVDIDLDAVTSAVTSCSSVLRLSGLPGRRATGIRVSRGTVEIHVVARWVAFLPDVGDEVRAAVAPLVGARPVTVIIDDLDVAALGPAGQEAGE
jgi:hypothetical protein